MTDKLSLYNGALGELEEDRLASLTENRKPRRVLDDNFDPVVAYCLERKFWNFSYRSVTIEADGSLTPAFGYANGFKIPDDWIRTRSLSASPFFDPPLLGVIEEAGYWYANVAPIFVQYNSNDPQYGMNLGLWPASFVDYVQLRLAAKSCKRVTGSTELLDGPLGLLKREEKAYKIASANCAMNEAVGFRPQSSWIRARRGLAPLSDDPVGSLLG